MKTTDYNLFLRDDGMFRVFRFDGIVEYDARMSLSDIRADLASQGYTSFLVIKRLSA